MPDVKEIDPVLSSVKKAIRQLGVSVDGPLGQQILLLGDAFYGYRFTGKDITAVWAAADQTLNVFDQNGKRLGSSIINILNVRMIDGEGTIRIPQPSGTRKVA
jgi:hypothetical protein